MFNNDLSYAVSRVQGTYMFNKTLGQLMLIDHIEPDGGSNRLDRATIHQIGRDSEGVAISAVGVSGDLQFQVGRFGYVNPLEGPTKFITRAPLRREYRQGIRSSQLNFTREGSVAGVSTGWLNTNSKRLSDTICSMFPSNLGALFEDVEEKGVATAFSRYFALTQHFKLAYRGNVVGKVDKADKFKLNTDKMFLIEELSQVVGEENIAR